jgi:proteasome regulatory subunit
MYKKLRGKMLLACLFSVNLFSWQLKLSDEVKNFINKNPSHKLSKEFNRLSNSDFIKKKENILSLVSLLTKVSKILNISDRDLKIENLRLNRIRNVEDYIDNSQEGDKSDSSEDFRKRKRDFQDSASSSDETVSQRLKSKDEFSVPDVKIDRDIIGGVPIDIQILIQQFKGDCRCQQVGMKRPKAVLFHGPPGCGKTLLAMGIANELRAKFMHVSVPSFISKWIGEGAEKVRELFVSARESARSGPVVIFFDELDAFGNRSFGDNGSDHQHYTSPTLELQTQLDGVVSRKDLKLPLYVLAATNQIGRIDPALIRSGRFENIEIPLPDKEKLTLLLRKKLEVPERNISSDFNLERVVEKCNGFNCADIDRLIQDSAKKAYFEAFCMKKARAEISQKHFEESAISIQKNKNNYNQIPPELKMTLYM